VIKLLTQLHCHMVQMKSKLRSKVKARALEKGLTFMPTASTTHSSPSHLSVTRCYAELSIADFQHGTLNATVEASCVDVAMDTWTLMQSPLCV
jgi:hypothetical protein